MFSELRKHWDAFRQLEPGRRFQTQYQRRRQRGKRPLQRALEIGAIALALAIGVVLAFIPGPAIVFFALAAGLLGMQSRTIARALDRTELWLRSVLTKAKAWWRKRFAHGEQVGRSNHSPRQT